MSAKIAIAAFLVLLLPTLFCLGWIWPYYDVYRKTEIIRCDAARTKCLVDYDGMVFAACRENGEFVPCDPADVMRAVSLPPPDLFE